MLLNHVFKGSDLPPLSPPVYMKNRQLRLKSCELQFLQIAVDTLPALDSISTFTFVDLIMYLIQNLIRDSHLETYKTMALEPSF